jgi:hypothetical protein
VAPSLVTPDEAEASAPTRLFTSKRFGYTIGYPSGWTADAAPRRKQGEALEAGRTADEFTAPAGDPRTFTVTARMLGGDVVDETWLGTFVPNPRSIRGSACLQADGTPTSINSYARANVAWSETVVGGRPARMRALCGHVQAVLAVGERAYVLWLATKARSPGGDTYASARSPTRSHRPLTTCRARGGQAHLANAAMRRDRPGLDWRPGRCHGPSDLAPRAASQGRGGLRHALRHHLRRRRRADDVYPSTLRATRGARLAGRRHGPRCGVRDRQVLRHRARCWTEGRRCRPVDRC